MNDRTDESAVSHIIDTARSAQRAEDALKESLAVVVDGKQYWRVDRKPVVYELPKREYLKVSTLSGLVDYIVADPDGLKPTTALPLILHVASPETVVLRGRPRADDTNSRESYVVASHTVKPFGFGSYFDRETFQVGLAAMFDQSSGQWGNLMTMVGNIVEDEAVVTKDDGFSQNVVVRSGVTSAEKVSAPNPVLLAPYRSFPEVIPITSRFILRLKGGGKTGGPVQCALFEADGGAWAADTVKAIHLFLMNALADLAKSGGIVVVR